MKKPDFNQFFTTKEIKPTGWMLEQLRLQATGLSGNLQEVWPDVRDSKWIGGNCEGWERVPYWLDGFIPLAYLLEDKNLIAVAEKYINCIINGQEDDGWICPCPAEEREKYDIWAIFLVCKTLTVYYECTDDKRAIEAVYKAAKNCRDMLKEDKIKLAVWADARWFEMLVSLCKLDDIYHEDWIADFGRELYKNGMDYETHIEEWKVTVNTWTQQTHIVNLGMMLKSEALCCRLFGEEYTDKAERLVKVLSKYNGTAVGTFTGDECLSGISAIQGTELCGVVELMYSYEHLFACTGNVKWLDRLEKVAFNALPATLSDDMWTHQYDQQVNQIACQQFPGRSLFRSNGAIAHLFGLDPNYGCCTANFNQGWPKFALSAFYKSRNGILCGSHIPALLNTEIDGVNVSVELKTDYPFRNRLEYIIKADSPVRFEFAVPLPQWAEKITLNGKEVSGKILRMNEKWVNDTLVFEFYDTPKIVNRPEHMKCVCYGPLTFSLPIKTKYVQHERGDANFMRKFPYCDYELVPQSDWNYGLSSDSFEVVEEQPLNRVPFSSTQPRIKLIAKVSHINWGLENGFLTVCRRTPISSKACGPVEERELFPYGCAKLRITEMPIARK